MATRHLGRSVTPLEGSEGDQSSRRRLAGEAATFPGSISRLRVVQPLQYAAILIHNLAQ